MGILMKFDIDKPSFPILHPIHPTFPFTLHFQNKISIFTRRKNWIR